MSVVRKYIEYTKSYNPVRFVLESCSLAIVLKILVGIVAGGLFFLITGKFDTGELPPPGYKEISNPVVLFFLLCIIAPVLETIFLQWIPIKLLQRVNIRDAFVVLVDATVFSMLHISYGFFYMITSLPVGIVFAWGFIRYAEKSTFNAFLMTSSIHALYNFSAFLFLILL